MQRVKIGEFRDRASALIRRAAEGETIVIMNRDRAIAKVVPFKTPGRLSGGFLGCMAGTATITGDIESPIGKPEDWFTDPVLDDDPA